VLALIAADPTLLLGLLVAAALAGFGLGMGVQRHRQQPRRTPASPARDAADPAAVGPRAVPHRIAPPVPPEVSPDPERRTLGRYRLEGLIGRGAMGAVYLGRDPSSGRELAIKTMALTSEFSGASLEEARRRFFREAETAGRLCHPDIVEIAAAGEDDGLAWIAMERLRGHDLSAHTLPERLLPPEEAVAIVARVAEALAHAHAQGVVHRDVKPANVMIDAASDQVKVTDFGIARVVDATRTRTGVVLGTPSYMSPEQLSGRRVDGRSDLYSLGVMLFQLLTGRLPHEAPTMARLMYGIANTPAPDLRSLRPDLPQQLADAVALALQKQPEMRCADGRAWAADLRTIAGMPPAPPPTSAAGRIDATARLEPLDPMQNPRP
jgi:eukaryotic-like serine/threonine-protein kinase